MTACVFWNNRIDRTGNTLTSWICKYCSPKLPAIIIGAVRFHIGTFAYHGRLSTTWITPLQVKDNSLLPGTILKPLQSNVKYTR